MTAGPAREAPTLPGLTFVKHLGTGGYADVFLYEQSEPVKRQVAVKVLHVDDLDDEVQRQFATEANTMGLLSDHPYIVDVMWADVTADGRPYLVMKYYPKPNLLVRARRERFSVVSVLKIGIQVSSAVETAHRARILHRDIKPANILTAKYNDPALTDFGIAAATADSVSAAVAMSVPWAPPEVLLGTSDGDHRSDVYSLGATLWHLLSGHAPYNEPGGDNSVSGRIRRIQRDPVPAVPRTDVPESLQRLLRQALAKLPEGRPQSAHVFARALQAIEREQHLAPTEIVVPDVVAPGSSADDNDEDTPTWVRSVRIIEAQPEERTTKRRQPVPPRVPPVPEQVIPPVAGPVPEGQPLGPVPVPVTGPRRERAPIPEPRVERTVLRPKMVSAEESADAKPIAGAGSGQRFAPFVAAGMVAVAVAAGLVALGHTTGPDAGRAVALDADETPNPILPQDAVAPGDPTLRWTRPDSRHVRFTVSYDSRKGDDEFRWVRTDPRSKPETKKGTDDLDVVAPRGTRVCYTVQVIRARERTASKPSSEVCAK